MRTCLCCVLPAQDELNSRCLYSFGVMRFHEATLLPLCTALTPVHHGFSKNTGAHSFRVSAASLRRYRAPRLAPRLHHTGSRRSRRRCVIAKFFPVAAPPPLVSSSGGSLHVCKYITTSWLSYQLEILSSYRLSRTYRYQRRRRPNRE